MNDQPNPTCIQPLACKKLRIFWETQETLTTRNLEASLLRRKRASSHVCLATKCVSRVSEMRDYQECSKTLVAQNTRQNVNIKKRDIALQCATSMQNDVAPCCAT